METLSRRPESDPPSRVRYIRRGDHEFADRLNHLYRPPEGLWAKGPARLPGEGMIGIVGTRRATEYGRRMAHGLAFDLATEGWTIVSGLAGGIDAAAHRGALAAGGLTIGVLGCGVDRVYPAANRKLYESISRVGLLLSEYSPDETPRRWHFPERNRIIAALASAVVVVQAGEKSGALITAKLALEIGREVAAVPGPADQPVSRGVHGLLKDGATLVETAQDVLDQLCGTCGGGRALPQGSLFDAGRPPAEEVSSPATRLLAALASGPAIVDELAHATGIAVPETRIALCRMELAGAVRSLPGHRFERVRP